MNLRLNRILDKEQIAGILSTLFVNRPIKILKIIYRTGRNFSSVPWVYYENQITGDRFATFISFQDLLQNFWMWLDTVKLFALAYYQRQNISQAVWHFVNQGDEVYHQILDWGKIVEKQSTENSKQLHFCLELDDRIEIVEPCYIEVF